MAGPRNLATKVTREPPACGGAVCDSTDLMLTYHSGALSGFAAKAATASRGRAISILVTTSTLMAEPRQLLPPGDDNSAAALRCGPTDFRGQSGGRSSNVPCCTRA